MDLNNLASMGYQVAELAKWVGPSSEEISLGTLTHPQGTLTHPQGTLEGVARTLPADPERLEVIQNTPSQGQVRPLGQLG
ncbi:hypothetical protein ACFL0D_03475 [Thermoproteota archaeon]